MQEAKYFLMPNHLFLEGVQVSELLSIVGSTLLVSAISFIGILSLPSWKKSMQGWLILLVVLSAGVLMGDALFCPNR